ncbi:MAG: hypothetical protein L6371_06265 [Candidatus Atribacteria bacterium]|nr:hypothetical protein [Candidatus Atribacteria bacterium]
MYAKEIWQIPDLDPKNWGGYNVSPDGKVSEELLASQMKAKPANTRAPESFLADGLRVLNTHAKNKLGIKLLKEHESIPELLKKTHRFRALDRTGLFSLAKDMARITADSLDVASIQTIVQPPKNIKWGSLKSLEHLISIKVGPEVARSILSRFFGVYELRHGDAHLPSSQINEALTLIGIDQSLPYIYQGYQLLHACVSSIFSIADILSKWDE